MRLGRVVGSLWCTAADPGLSGRKLLLVELSSPDGRGSGRILTAADAVGAGSDEQVFLVEGREAALAFSGGSPPVDASVVGIVDEIRAVS